MDNLNKKTQSEELGKNEVLGIIEKHQKWIYVDGVYNFVDVVISNVKFKNIYLEALFCENCVFDNCTFENCTFEASSFDTVDFNNCVFKGVATMRFNRCDVRNVIFISNKFESNVDFNLCKMVNVTGIESGDFMATKNCEIIKNEEN